MKQQITISKAHISHRQLADGLRHTLQNNCGRVLGNASRNWERMFAGKEPSDACVSVRITGGTRATLDRFHSARQQYASLTA